MTAKYYVDATGKYIGAFDGSEPPEGAVEVDTAPADGRMTWSGLEWLPAPAAVPQIVSKAQGIRALYDVGELDRVEALVAGADRATQLAWANVAEFHRDSPMIAALGAGLDLDALFIHAASIKL